jgi:uncharacterized repeat protein (TIGR02543 family)
MGVNDAAKDVSITGAITNQDTASVNTILYNNSITLKANAVLSVNGVLLSGTAGKFVGPNTVTCYVQPTSSGGEIVLGSQATAYTVQIVMGAIVQNNGSSPTRVTKAGLGNGVLQRLNTYTGVTTINGGLLRVLKWDNGGNPSGLGQSSKAAENLVINGGALCYGNVNPTLHVTTDRLFTIGAAGARLDCSSTGGNPVSNWDIGGGGSIAFSSSSAPASLTLANDTGPSGIGTLSAVLGDSGTGANVTSVTKTGLGTWQLAAANTYTGNTTILTGGTLTLTSTGTLKFAPGANDICNKVTGGGTANFNGTFNIDTTNADTTTGNAWTLVDVTNKTYSLINITDFTNSSGVWTKVDGTKTWTFDQSTGKLSLVNSGGTTYTVTFNNNGGSGTMTAMTGSSAAALTSNTFTRTGYTFTGWNTASNGLGTPYADGASYAFTANATMYAQWTANTYTVTFDGNGGETPSPTSMSVTYDSTYGTLATVTRALYTFNGWFTAASGGTLVTSASTVAITDAQTLYAQWTLTPITYTVTFDNNTGSGTMTAQTGSSAANLTNNTFTKTGYIFAGWNTLADNTGTAYADGASYAFTASTTLYAQWTAVPTSTGATLAALENTATALAESDFGYANTANPASVLAAVQIIELPALGTLTYISTATPVAKDDIILAAYIGNLSYLSPLGGFGSPYTTIGIKVQNSDTPTGLWSLPAIMTVNVTHVNHAPTSTGGSVILRENTVKTFASTDFQFSDADSGDALSAIKVVTSLPAGTLNLGLTPVGLGDVIPVASIGTLTYTPALNYTGPDSFNFQVSDGIAFSANATMAITVTPDILVSNGSFETPGTSASGPWATFGSPWVLTNPPAGSLPYQQLKAVDGGAFTSAPDGLWVGLINEDDCPITAPLTQNLGVSVADGDTLTVTFQSGRQLNAVGGTGVAYFDVDGTKYTTPFDTTTLTAGAWQLTTMTHAITNSGNLTLGFYGTTGHTINAWIDNISNVSVSTGPPAVTYAAWASTNGAGTQTMEQDHDNDGVSNGVEYFLGGNTNTTGFTALPGVVNTAGTLSVTWIKAADYTGVYGAASDYVVQTSTTLATGDWTDEPETGGDVTVTGTDVTYTFPSVGPVKFARLKVMGTP